MSKYKYFSEKEMACKCCGVYKMDDGFMKQLDYLRQECGFPFKVTSAYRCPKHNQATSNTGPTGPHTTGKAVDISVRGEQAMILIQKAVEAGFTGIGVSQKGTGRFIHLDTLTSPAYPRPNLWSY